jgi:hypothetical protein
MIFFSPMLHRVPEYVLWPSDYSFLPAGGGKRFLMRVLFPEKEDICADTSNSQL